MEVDPESVIIRPSTDCKFEAVRYAWSDYPCIMKKCAVYSGKLPSPPFIKYGPFEKNNHFEENGHWFPYI